MKKQQHGKKGKPASPSSPDTLTKGKKGGIELSEDQLKNVSGGLKIELKY